MVVCSCCAECRLDLVLRYLDRMREEMVEPDSEDAAPLQVSSSFGTISEYFFLTLRLLHMGLLSSFSMMERLMQQHSRLQQVRGVGQGGEEERRVSKRRLYGGMIEGGRCRERLGRVEDYAWPLSVRA